MSTVVSKKVSNEFITRERPGNW